MSLTVRLTQQPMVVALVQALSDSTASEGTSFWVLLASSNEPCLWLSKLRTNLEQHGSHEGIAAHLGRVSIVVVA